jgi:hypothetical protein
MAYHPHDLFTDPEGVEIWRYMDFTKLVSLLQKKALFFPSTRTLQNIDPWEGTYLKKELEHLLKENVRLMKDFVKEEVTFKKMKKKAEEWKGGFEHQIETNFISCWHYNTTESAAMWRLYLKSNEGIVIQTDIKSFKESFNNSGYEEFIGQVRYKNYETDMYYDDYDLSKLRNTGFNLFLPFIHKRKNYEYEKEYRAVIPVDDKKKLDTCLQNGGIFVPVDLKLLIKKIILAPGSPDWFKELVKETLRTYKLDVEVVRSVVDDEPYKFDLEPYKDLKE